MTEKISDFFALRWLIFACPVTYRSLGKFIVEYFRVKIVSGKIFSSLSVGVTDENFLTTKYFKVKLFVPLLKNLMHNYT